MFARLLAMHELFDSTIPPMETVAKWYRDACADSRVGYPNAVCLATVDPDGWPDSRVVLVQSVTETSFTFFNNLDSRKSLQIEKNPMVSATWYWQVLGRQVRMRGRATRLSRDENMAYFNTRPRISQLGAWVSHQSAELASYEQFMDEVTALDIKVGAQAVVCPENWGGWRVHPDEIEFWIEGRYRLHHRFRCQLTEGKWTITRLYP